MYIVFIYLFIIQKNISLLGRLCFLYLIPVVVVGAKMLMSFGHRGDICARKGLSPCSAALACHMNSLVVGLGSRHVQPVPFPETISI